MPKKIDYASLFTRRSDGRYQGYYRDADGKRHAVCDKDARRLYERIAEHERPAPATFADIAQAWEAEHFPKIRNGTRVCYQPALKRALETFGDVPAAEITPSDIDTLLTRLNAQQYSAKTIKTQRTVIKLIYEAAIISEQYGDTVTRNPALLTPLPSGMKRPKSRTAPEEDAVYTIRTSADDYFGLFPLFLLSTGARRGEALAVRWRDIDFAAGTISFSHCVTYPNGVAEIGEPKTEAGIRTVPILPDLAAHLHRPSGAKPSDFVFSGDDPTKPMPQATYVRRWRHYCIDHGFVTDEPEQRISAQGKVYTKHNYKPSLTAHVLRHGYATLLFEADVDVYTAKTLIGHANVETTMAIYTHLRKRKKNDSLEKLRNHVLASIEETAAG